MMYSVRYCTYTRACNVRIAFQIRPRRTAHVAIEGRVATEKNIPTRGHISTRGQVSLEPHVSTDGHI